jgi:broad specificity phosphatase PhoE
MTRYRFIKVAALVFAAGVHPLTAQSRGATTVILVRHAEKAAEPANDPPLTEAGRARAAALWNAVKDAHVSAAIVTQFARTAQTAEPTVATSHATVSVVTTTGADHAARVAAAVRAHPGETVLVVGHSNTVPDIIAALGLPKPAAICDSEYDNLYVVTMQSDGKTSMVHSRYGAPSPADSACNAMKMGAAESRRPVSSTSR